MAITIYESGRVVGRFATGRTLYSLTGVRSNDARRVINGERQTAGGFAVTETKRLTPTHGESHIRVINADGTLVAVFRDMDTLKAVLRPDMAISRDGIVRTGDDKALFTLVVK